MFFSRFPAGLIGATIVAISFVSPEPAETQTCFRGQPLPDCRSFVFTESGYLTRLAAGNAQRHYVNANVGMARNLSDRDALGFTFFVGALVDYSFDMRFGLEPRYRRWLTDVLSLNLSAGPLLYQKQGTAYGVWALGVGGQAALDFDDVFSLVLRTELTDLTQYRGDPDWPTFWTYEQPASDWATFLGFRMGSKPAVYVTGAVGLLAAVGAAVCGSNGCGSSW